METTGKQIINNVNSVKNGQFTDERQQKNYATISGAGVGAIIGIYYGYSKNKNMLAFALLGAVLGAIATRALSR